MIGIPISIQEAQKILISLGFICKKGKKDLKVEIPSWRPDIKQDVDLIEELIRIKGFKNIKLISPERQRENETLNFKQKIISFISKISCIKRISQVSYMVIYRL